jgi:hypothetical protein
MTAERQELESGIPGLPLDIVIGDHLNLPSGIEMQGGFG